MQSLRIVAPRSFAAISPTALISRRELLRTFGAGAFAFRSLAVQTDEPQFAGLDHLEFYVSNVEKSRDFFVRIFGNTLKNRNGKRYLKLGSTYMAFEATRGGQIRVDHFSVSVKQLDMMKLHAFLDQRSVMYQDYPSGRDTGITDSDGIRTQLSPEDGWNFLNTPNFPAETAPVQEEPVFHPIAMDHMLLNVVDVEKSAGFYQRFLGQPVERRNNRLWFQIGTSRLGLLQTPAAERSGVTLFGLSAEPFQFDTAIKRLERAGAIEVKRPEETPESVIFQDLDGLRIQVDGRSPRGKE